MDIGGVNGVHGQILGQRTSKEVVPEIDLNDKGKQPIEGLEYSRPRSKEEHSKLGMSLASPRNVVWLEPHW